LPTAVIFIISTFNYEKTGVFEKGFSVLDELKLYRLLEKSISLLAIINREI